MAKTVLVTKPSGEIKAREFSHVEHFSSLNIDVDWPVYNPRKEMVYFSPAKGTITVTKRDIAQVAK